ncbi:MAG TPA: iron ABC transporter permease [Firmicutes bacterium]|uniref:Iron ABC transporter permease n=1 Tax=Capillibacterium thermochitinicola TaxID=2699427 RepID=A0A8J6LS06_9FIRM|nr:iron ABC transporter permease [Capillibacterium thermochitinicola]MBA2132782.1 iron ABC transporter permease [Capillibacterium thermochitinicola]HHW12977.1 iron ABC transporter permease [Bacillota bacterium]
MKTKTKYRLLLAGLMIGVGLTGLVALGLGPVQLSFPLDSFQAKILFDLRLPRILLALMVGAALAVAGVLFQGLFRNPLADPYILGTSSGAALGATIAVLSGVNFRFFGLSARPLFAFGGALLATALVYILGRSGRRPALTIMLLAGIAVGAFFSAMTSLLLFFRQEELGKIMFWMMGGFSYARWAEVGIILPYLGGAFLYSWSLARQLNLLLLGEEKAHQLGLAVGEFQRRLVITASVLVAAAVSVSGAIGFIGMVAPHIVRLLIGPDHRSLLPASALAGGLLLLVADTLARTLLSPVELPVGVLTSFIGGPFFLYLLHKGRSAWY